MDNKLFHVSRPILPLEQKPKAPRQDGGPPVNEGFHAVLARMQGKIKFSHHALQRLQNRNITMTAGNVDRLRAAVERAAGKGARESLVLMDELAFVVSIKNKTVITAMDEESMKEHVFTNIDSAVIVK